MDHIVFWDTEHTSDKGSLKRGWAGIDDPPRFVVQIGAIKVRLEAKLPTIEEFVAYVEPLNHQGKPTKLSGHFTSVTGITNDVIARKGRGLEDVLNEFSLFVGDSNIFSYDRDLTTCIAPSCAIADIKSPLASLRAFDIRKVFRDGANISEELLYKNGSGSIASALGVTVGDDHKRHDARDDAQSILAATRHLIRTNKLPLRNLIKP